MEPDLDSAPHCERDDPAENCDIEITPEMRAAGFAAVENSVGVLDYEGIAIEAYTAMARAKARHMAD